MMMHMYLCDLWAWNRTDTPLRVTPYVPVCRASNPRLLMGPDGRNQSHVTARHTWRELEPHVRPDSCS